MATFKTLSALSTMLLMKALIQTNKWDVRNDGDIDHAKNHNCINTYINFYFDVDVPN
jgi:hypothetical protein